MRLESWALASLAASLPIESTRTVQQCIGFLATFVENYDRTKYDYLLATLYGARNAPLSELIPPQECEEQPAIADPTAGLNETQSQAYRIIRDEGPIAGKNLAKKLGIEDTTLRKHILPPLRDRGVRNDRTGDGYYLNEKPM